MADYRTILRIESCKWKIFLPYIKRLSCKILPIAFGELIVKFAFVAFSPEYFRTNILQDVAVQSTTHFHALSLRHGM
jgi:hypothetical protein